MKKILIGILAAALSLSLVLTGCGDGGESPAGGVVEGTLDAAATSAAATIASPSTQAPATEGNMMDNIGAQAKAYASGVYYLEGTFYSESDPYKVKIAVNQMDYQMAVTVSGLELSIVSIGGTQYVLLPSTKQYTELSDTLMSDIGVDMGEVPTLSDSSTGAEVVPTQQAVATINGEAGYCTVFDGTEGSKTYIYNVGDKLIQVETYDSNGALTSQIAVDTFSETIPADQVTLSGCEKVGVTSFISAIVKAIAAVAVQ